MTSRLSRSPNAPERNAESRHRTTRVQAKDSIYARREKYSRKRLKELRSKLAPLDELKSFPSLTIVAAGSYGRLEASEYSDIDLFFLRVGSRENLIDPRTRSMRLFGRVITVLDELGFPKLSNDCAFVDLVHTEDILSNLGGPVDDHANYFTARMLLLLESRCVYGEQAFDDVTATIVESYFKDFPDHSDTFRPIFLLNDICRYWKTLLLNYENKRKFRANAPVTRARKTEQRVKNFKLKFSRMTTCFATIAALGSFRMPMTEQDVTQLTRLTPRERLELVPKRVPITRPIVASILEEYSWFLQMTQLRTADLEEHFRLKRERMKIYQRANKFGDGMYSLIETIGTERPDLRLLRMLVI